MSDRNLSEALDRLYDAVTDLETQVRAQTSDQPSAASLDPMAARAAGQVESGLDEEGFEISSEGMTVEPMTKAVPAKPGYQTTEFWVMVLATVGAIAASATDNLPPRYAAFASIVSAVAYQISRGLAKF